MAEGRILTLVGSAPPNRPKEWGGWEVRTVATAFQETLEVADPVLHARMEAAQALALTSPRAARWLASRDVPASLQRPVLVSGPATGAILPDRWTRLVPPVPGGAAVADLAFERGLRSLLFLSAEETAGTLERRAAGLGLSVEVLPVYRTVCVDDLRASDRDALDQAGAIGFLSPSAVRNLAELDRFRFDYLARRLVAVAGGDSTRESLSALGWRAVRTAVGPSTADIVAALEEVP